MILGRPLALLGVKYFPVKYRQKTSNRLSTSHLAINAINEQTKKLHSFSGLSLRRSTQKIELIDTRRDIWCFIWQKQFVYFKQFDRWDQNCANVYSFELRNTSRSIWSVRRRCTCCNCLYLLGFIFRMRSLLIRTLILNPEN